MWNTNTIIDVQSRWIELIPLSDQKAFTLCDALDDEWFSRYPRLRIMLSDQEKQLIGQQMQELANSYGITTTTTTAYQATANSICERVHQTINNMIRCIGELSGLLIYKLWL